MSKQSYVNSKKKSNELSMETSNMIEEKSLHIKMVAKSILTFVEILKAMIQKNLSCFFALGSQWIVSHAYLGVLLFRQEMLGI